MFRVFMVALLLAAQQPAIDRLRQLRDDLTALLDGTPKPPDPTTTTTPVTCATLSAAIAAAKAGAVLVLQPGSDCGPIELKGSAGVTLTSAGPVPAPGARAGAVDAVSFAKIRANSFTPAVLAGDGAANWTLVGLEIVGHPQSNNNTVAFNGTSTHLVIDRCYIHGDPAGGAKNGVAMNSGQAAVINSTVVDFKRAGQDTQAIVGTQGSGPYLVENNLLEASGENILFGGDDPQVQDVVPSDITIRRNLIRKPMEWRGQPWTVKNLVELKNARRVVIEDNVIENVWVMGQIGFAIVFTPRNQGGRCTWCTVEDVTFQRNTIRHMAGGFNLLGTDDTPGSPSKRMTNVRILDNVLEDLDGNAYGSNGRTFQMGGGPLNVLIRGTKVSGQNVSSAMGFYGAKTEGLVVDGNIFQEGEYGITGDNTGVGLPSLEAFAPGYVWTNNTMIKTQTVRTMKYPPGTVIQ